jgi:hypothetical protein
MGKRDVAGSPDYRWDLPRRRGGVIRLGSKGGPDYEWEKHFKSIQPRSAPTCRTPPLRAQSDSTDYAPRMPVRASGADGSRRQSAFWSLVDTVDSNPAGNEDQNEEHDDGEVVTCYNWATKETILIQSPADLASPEFESSSQAPTSSPPSTNKRHVRFSTELCQYFELPAFNAEYKSDLYWTSSELRSFREVVERENIEEQLRKQQAVYGNASASLSSFFGSTTSTEYKSKGDKARKEAARREREARKEAELQAAIDNIQEMLKQADWLEGY